jgi:hypothetical protein
VADRAGEPVQLGHDEDLRPRSHAQGAERGAQRAARGDAGVDDEVGELPAALTAGGGDGGALGVEAEVGAGLLGGAHAGVAEDERPGTGEGGRGFRRTSARHEARSSNRRLRGGCPTSPDRHRWSDPERVASSARL